MLTGATLADVSNEYFTEAYGIHDPGRYCREYDSHQRDSAHHIATHPPGAVLTYYGLIRLYRATGLSVSAQGLVEWLHGQRAGAIMDQAARLPTVRRIPSDRAADPIALTRPVGDALRAPCGGLWTDALGLRALRRRCAGRHGAG